MDIFLDDEFCNFFHFENSTRDFLKDMQASEFYKQQQNTPCVDPNVKRSILSGFDMDFSIDANEHSGLSHEMPDLDLVKMQKEMNLKPEEVL
jgi:hypothetical protein